MIIDDKTRLWDALVEHGACSEETLKVVANGWGYTLDNLETVLFVTTGYRSYEQWSETDFDLGQG